MKIDMKDINTTIQYKSFWSSERMLYGWGVYFFYKEKPYYLVSHLNDQLEAMNFISSFVKKSSDQQKKEMLSAIKERKIWILN